MSLLPIGRGCRTSVCEFGQEQFEVELPFLQVGSLDPDADGAAERELDAGGASDNPVLYEREHPCTEFIASVPTTWDELRVLHAECGEQLVVARRKGDRWYIGGITAEKPFEMRLSLDFLPSGRQYRMTSFEDGVNADLQAMDYRRRVRQVDASSSIEIRMTRNGGWAAVLE